MIEKSIFKDGANKNLTHPKIEKGITLIALVVTIIVLIILAGVSINLVLGDNGIITKARKGSENYLIAANEEQQVLANAEVTMEEIIGVSGTTPPQEPTTPVEYAPYDEPYIPTGFKYKEGTWNSGYTIIGETQSVGNEFVWVPCVLDQSKVKQGDIVVTFGKTIPSTTEETDPYYKYNEDNLGLLPTDTSVTEEDSSVAEIESSVDRYGGFYIAKYEAGIEGTTDNNSLETKTAIDGSVKPLSQSGKGIWNFIGRNSAITVSKAMINQMETGVKSTLISGEAWDTTLQWMVHASDNKTANVGYDTNSEGKGWYRDISSYAIHLAGYYAVNNIYDMAGNVNEWTTENGKTATEIYPINRGGNYTSNGDSYTAANRHAYGGTGLIYLMGFRVVMYK